MRNQPAHGLDFRPLKTLAWMMVGLIHSSSIRLGAWTPFVVSRAQESHRTGRRFRRWLDNEKSEAQTLYGPLMPQALGGWCGKRRSVALDTARLWHPSCIVRLAVISRGRAIPLGWCVLAPGSATGAYEVYKEWLDRAAALLPRACQGVFLADRGFAATPRRDPLSRLGWHFRRRITSTFWVYRPGRAPFQAGRIGLAPGHARFWPRVGLTGPYCGPVHLAGARPWGSDESWAVSSEEPTEGAPLQEYGWRFDLAENLLDDKSNGCQWESSLIRSAKALERWCFVLAMPPLYGVSVGTEVVKRGKRRLVEPHGFRGSSYLQIGGKWVRYALNRCYALIASLSLRSEPAPEPARASIKQAQKRQQRFAFAYEEVA